MTDAATHEPLRIGVLGAARITSLSLVEPARATGHRLVAVAARHSSRTPSTVGATAARARSTSPAWMPPCAQQDGPGHGGVEILSDEHRTMPVEAALSRAADSARHVL